LRPFVGREAGRKEKRIFSKIHSYNGPEYFN